MARKFEVKSAEREKLKFSAMFTGATGSGKTVGALLTAKGLIAEAYPDLDTESDEFWKKIGVVDTEHNRSKIYVNTTIGEDFIGRFQHLEFSPPYDVDSYVEAVNVMKEHGCEVIIVDSLTHAWDDVGGILDYHQELGGQFSTWQKIKPIMKKLYNAFTADTDIHIIATVRSKITYEATTSETGKMKVSKIGLKPVMRDDFEYEVLTAIHFDEEHKTSVIKDNTHIFDEGVLIDSKYGRELHNFLDQGVDIAAMRAEEKNKVIGTIEQHIEDNPESKELTSLMKTISNQAKRKYGILDWRELPLPALKNVLNKIEEEVA